MKKKKLNNKKDINASATFKSVNKKQTSLAATLLVRMKLFPTLDLQLLMQFVYDSITCCITGDDD